MKAPTKHGIFFLITFWVAAVFFFCGLLLFGDRFALLVGILSAIGFVSWIVFAVGFMFGDRK